MKSIKLVSIILAAALMASALCACSSKKGGDKNTPATTAAAAGETNAADNRVKFSSENGKTIFTIDPSFQLRPNSWLGVVPAGKDYKNEGEADEVDLIWIYPDTYEDGQTTPYKFTYDNEDLASIGNGEYIMVLCENDDDPDSKVFLYFPVKITGIIITADLSKLVIN